jgi:hypothetical protein
MKKIIIAPIGMGIILLIIGIYFAVSLDEKFTPRKENINRTIVVVNVEKVISTPDYYKGFLGIEGIVTKLDEVKNIFLLGCEDACISMPVVYKGPMPKLKSKVIVYGEIKKQEDRKYVFQAKEVKAK